MFGVQSWTMTGPPRVLGRLVIDGVAVAPALKPCGPEGTIEEAPCCPTPPNAPLPSTTGCPKVVRGVTTPADRPAPLGPPQWPAIPVAGEPWEDGLDCDLKNVWPDPGLEGMACREISVKGLGWMTVGAEGGLIGLLTG
jgi:hypothetical protein